MSCRPDLGPRRRAGVGVAAEVRERDVVTVPEDDVPALSSDTDECPTRAPGATDRGQEGCPLTATTSCHRVSGVLVAKGQFFMATDYRLRTGVDRPVEIIRLS